MQDKLRSNAHTQSICILMAAKIVGYLVLNSKWRLSAKNLRAKVLALRELPC